MVLKYWYPYLEVEIYRPTDILLLPTPNLVSSQNGNAHTLMVSNIRQLNGLHIILAGCQKYVEAIPSFGKDSICDFKQQNTMNYEKMTKPVS